MKRFFNIGLFAILILPLWVYGQTRKTTCDCPKSEYTPKEKADTVFNLSNGKTIVLCGYKNPDIKPATFSEFVLTVCGEDTIIGFWEAMQNCRLYAQKDTLFVDNLEYLPTGRNLKYQETIWATEKIYFQGEKVVDEYIVNRDIRKYSKIEIQKILKSYESAKYGLDDKKMDIANKLFIATLSGNEKARKYFKEFETKFGTLDGAFAEDYSNLSAMLTLWDKKK